MSQDDLFKIVASVPAVVAPLFPLFNTVLPALKWRDQAETRVGKPGREYLVAVYLPQVILVIVLIVSIVAAFSLLVVGALLLLQPPPPSVLRYQYLFDYPHIIFIAVIVFALTLMANFTPIPRLMVRVMYWLDHCRFTHGWANANWQLHHYKTFFALGVEEVEIERLANGAIAEIIASGRASQEAQTPQPAGLSRSELANYLLIGCTMEKGLSRLYPKDRQRPLAAWKFLAGAATNQERPFAPAFLNDKSSSDAYFDRLRSALPSPTTGAVMPTDPVIRDGINEAVGLIRKKCKGDAERLPRLWGGKPSANLLSFRLRPFAHLLGGMQPVLIKVAVRMGVWPGINVGAFQYAYADGLAVLFLNAGCVVPPNDTKEIETDDTFRDLIAGVEDLVILRAHRTFASAHPSQEAVTAARDIFGVASPAEVDLYRFKDYMDLFLWDHSRKYCMKRLKEAGAELGCRVALSDTGCACDRTDSTWIRIDRVLARREVK